MGVGKTTFKFSTSSITIDGGSTVINLTRDNQSYTNKLSHGYGDIYTYPSGTVDYTWKPTAAQLTKFFEEVPAQKSRLIDVYLDTYNGSTKVGRDTHALTVTLSEATAKPTVSGFAISDSNTVSNGLGVIISGKSKLTASFTATGKYGASIVKKAYTYGSNEYTDISSLVAAMPLTTTPTAYTIGCKATDTRGFSTTATLSKTIARYQAPQLDTFEVVRCNTSGVESDNGTKAKVIVKGSWAALKVGTAYKNPATLKVGYKTKTATAYTYQTITVSAGTVNISQLLSATLTAGTDYEFSVQLTDKFETYSETGVGFSNVKNILYVSADGNELVIGSDTDGNVLIDNDSVDIRTGSTVNATFGKDLIELGKNSDSSVVSLHDGKFKFESSLENSNFSSAQVINNKITSDLTLSEEAFSIYGKYNRDGKLITQTEIQSWSEDWVSDEDEVATNRVGLSLWASAASSDGFLDEDSNSESAGINIVATCPNTPAKPGSTHNCEIDIHATRIIHESYNTPKFRHSQSGTTISVGVGDGGINRGIWDDEFGRWMIYSSDTDKSTYINGISYNFVYASYAVTSSKSIAANSYVNGNTTLTKSGYRPFAVAGATVNNRYVVVNRAYLSEIASGKGTLNWMVSNHHSSAHDTTATVYVLWIRE